MSNNNNHANEDDRAFEELFSSLNDITASDELKASTLSALFAAMDEEDQADDDAVENEPAHEEAPASEVLTEEAPQEVEKTAQRPRLKLVEDKPAEEQAPSAPTRVRKQRSKSWRLRVAAAILAVVIGLSGGIAYAVPAKHVQVTVGNDTFDLGVNVFGMTVSAEANSEEAAAILSSAGIQHMRFEDSLDKLLGSFDDDRSAPRVSISIGGQPAQEGQTLSEEAASIVERHEQKLEENARERQHEEEARAQEQGTPQGSTQQVPQQQQEQAQPQEQQSQPQEQTPQQQGGEQGQGSPSNPGQTQAPPQEQQQNQPQAAQSEGTAQLAPQSTETQGAQTGQDAQQVSAEGNTAPTANHAEDPNGQR